MEEVSWSPAVAIEMPAIEKEGSCGFSEIV